MDELRVIPVTWPLGAAFKERYTYGAEALCVWRLLSPAAGRVYLQFTDAPSGPDADTPAFPVREGDVFYHRAKHVWVVVPEPPSWSPTRALDRSLPYMQLIAGPACSLPRRTTSRPLIRSDLATGSGTDASALTLTTAIALHHLTVFVDSGVVTVKLLEGLTAPVYQARAEQGAPVILSPRLPLYFGDQNGTSPVTVGISVEVGPSNWMVNAAWEPAEGVGL